MKRFFKKIAGFIKSLPVFSIVCFSILLLCGIVHIFCLIFPRFADWVNLYPAGGVRWALAKVTGVLPFSLGETVMLMLPILVVFLIVFVSVQAHRQHYDLLRRFYAVMFAVISIYYSTFVLTLATGYHGTTLDQKLDLECKDLDSDQLIEVTKWLRNKVNEYAEKVYGVEDSYSVMPYDVKTLNEKLNEAYDKAAKDYDFILGFSSHIKTMTISRFMSKAGILGVYTYYTGETNVNTDYFDYNLVYTCAHEMSHQRGIARENEANFMAFLVCRESDDPYINYSGYLNMFEYMLNPLYKALKAEDNTGAYYSLLSGLDPRARTDFGLANEKTIENKGTVSNVTNKINDTFIKSQGDKHGTASYGLVIELAAAYYYAGNR